MTTELEKQFFETFEIEPRGKKCSCDVKDFAKCFTYYCSYCDKALEKVYPIITDTQYLELICLLAENGGYICSDEVKELKKEVLKALIRCYKEYSEMDYKDSDEWAEELKTKIQALFKGE